MRIRRNFASLIKYIVVAAIIFIFGPLFFKRIATSDYSSVKENVILDIDRRQAPVEPAAPADPLEEIDWHDEKSYAAELLRQGPGEQGSSVHISSSENVKKEELFRANGFSGLASDKMSFYRSVRDIRHPDCKHQKYIRNLPTVSIIVPFHQEHWSTLLRTVVSTLRRAPRHLIKEIILVDDFSSKPFLKKPLDDYVQLHFDNVHVLRATKREGLIRTRLLGARNATGDVLIFLDSHSEANINWLPPLLDPIQRDYRTVVCPFIDVIDMNTFEYRAQDEGARGAFDWELFYKRLPLLPEDLKHPSRPFKSPVMAGGLFAISRKWFWELGGYDPGLEIWGGEQYELSFKIWQCGGTMVDAPCSRIGHVYRQFSPFPNPAVGDFVGRNFRRVADVWMDEYAEFIYKRRPQYRSINPGDLTDQRAIRNRLQCKPFKWFMTEVAFDLLQHYPAVEPPIAASGEVRSLGATGMCIDTKFKSTTGDTFGLEPCIKESGGNGEQQFEFTWHKDIRPKKRNMCFDVPVGDNGSPVILYPCHGQKGNQQFRLNPYNKQIFHVATSKCLEADGAAKRLSVADCDSNKDVQKWIWGMVKEELIKRDW